VLDAADLVLERLARAVAALVQLEDRVDALHAQVERDRVELADDREDVLSGALEGGAMACIWKRTRFCFCSRRWISAMYSLALSSWRPSARTVRSAVAIGLEGYARAPPRAG